MNRFNFTQLPFTKEIIDSWNANGFLVIENFYSNDECDNLRNRANLLVKNFDPKSVQSIFDTNKQEHVDDRYFLESGDKIRFFFEDKAFDQSGNLIDKKELNLHPIIIKMKEGIHPENYRLVAFKDMSNDDVFITKSTVDSKDSIEHDGVTYPLVKLEISRTSHPFYTGKTKLIDTAGRIDKFKNRYAKLKK